MVACWWAMEEAIERRRAAEAARKEHIFDTRNRVIGLDLSNLKKQVAERTERERVERVRDKAFESLSAVQDALLKQQFAEEDRSRAELSQELIQFRKTHQRAQDSRDADLNFKLAHNAPVSEEKLGPSSMQGGDCMVRERKRAQMEENERLLKAQTQEKEKIRIHQKQTELLWGQAQLQQDFQELQLDAMEDKCKRDAQVALCKYNLAQAAERAQQQKMDMLKEEGENFKEVWHMMTSDLLTECPEAADRGGGGAGRGVLLDRWKGMSAEQLNAIHRQRDEQLAERERLREAKRQREAAWDSLQMAQSREGEEEEKRERDRERQRRRDMDRYNMQLAREQQAHHQYLEKNLYTNRPAASFFTQFGTSSR